MSTPTATMERTAARTRTRTRGKAGAGAEDPAAMARATSIHFKQVSDPTRLQILLLLLDGEKFVGELCSSLAQSQPAVSHHIALLRTGRIIESHRRGKNNFYALTDQGRMLAETALTLCRASA